MLSRRFCKCVSATLCLLVPTAARSQQTVKDDSANLVLAHRREQGELSAEGVTIGQRWGARLGVAVAKDLVDAGISLTPSGR